MKKFLMLLFVLGFALNVHGLLCLNDVSPTFPEGTNRALIEGGVVFGAIHFLNSKSYADLLLMEYEKSAHQDFNYELAIDYIEKSIAELEISKSNYLKAKEIGENVGYIQRILICFKEYDYDKYIIENNLNREIAEIVKHYFKQSDILAVYQNNIDNINGILNTLYYIRDNLKINKMPTINSFWKLLEQYSYTTLFGNYASRIGRDVISNCE